MTFEKTFIVDNGASSVKAGYAHDPTNIDFPNCVARSLDRKVFVGNQINSCENTTRLYMKTPFEKGYLVSWDIQKEIWDRLFYSNKCVPSSTCLLLTEPPFNLPNIRNTTDEIVFEEYGFQSYNRQLASTLGLYTHYHILKTKNPTHDHLPECSIVIDSGYSFTHIIPHINHQPHLSAIVKINVGGKLLTNRFKEVISFRHFNMMDETFIVNQLKESICICSTDLQSDLKKTILDKSPFRLDYILPDFVNRFQGCVKTKEDDSTRSTDQTIQMNNERFTIPELLFHPNDLGITQAGIGESIVQSINACPADYGPLFAANLFTMGGSCKMEGFTERVLLDTQSLLPDWYPIKAIQSERPEFSAVDGGRIYVDEFSTLFQSQSVTIDEFKEAGHSIWKRKGLL